MIDIKKIYQNIPIENKDYSTFLFSLCNILIFEDVLFDFDLKCETIILKDVNDKPVFYECLQEVIYDMYSDLTMDEFLEIIFKKTFYHN